MKKNRILHTSKNAYLWDCFYEIWSTSQHMQTSACIFFLLLRLQLKYYRIPENGPIPFYLRVQLKR